MCKCILAPENIFTEWGQYKRYLLVLALVSVLLDGGRLRAEGSGLGSTLKHRNTQTRILGFGLQNSVATYSLH